MPTCAASLPALQALLSEVSAHNPFYGRKFTSVGDSAKPASLDDFRRRFPFTTKAELVADQLANPPFGTNLTCPLPTYTRCHQTSGTTGLPLRWLDTADSWNVMVRDWAEVLRRAGLIAGDRILFAFSFGPFLGFWLAFEAAQQLGCLCFAGGGMSSAQRARVLVENGCTVLCCTPTYALHLAEVLQREKLDRSRSRVRILIVAGEPGGSLPTTRQGLSDAWNGARIFDHHGMTEVGPVTYEHPQSPHHLVLLERSFFAEIIHPITTKPVQPGEPGELVLTTLLRIASPVIRYRTGDLVVRATEGSVEEEGTVFQGGILGRLDDMLIIRGVNIYPSAIDDHIGTVVGSAEYRVTCNRTQALHELSIEIEADATGARRLEERLQTSLGLRVPVTPVLPGSLPRFELKARRWRNV
ncbi:MAG: phenylacetate--CoA ligase family protein [Pedosphaera sp.]|nr:phenylacetate--CoA ligase family protein [Pedosphaera sp.]